MKKTLVLLLGMGTLLTATTRAQIPLIAIATTPSEKRGVMMQKVRSETLQQYNRLQIPPVQRTKLEAIDARYLKQAIQTVNRMGGGKGKTTREVRMKVAAALRRVAGAYYTEWDGALTPTQRKINRPALGSVGTSKTN